MNLTPLQQYCQEQILKRLYPSDDIEQAKGKETFLKGCLSVGELSENIIGLPPTLSRVLTALGVLTVDNGGWGRAILYRDGSIYDYSYPDLDEQQKICDWKLLNEDLSDATLFNQSEETIEAIGKLLGYNE